MADLLTVRLPRPLRRGVHGHRARRVAASRGWLAAPITVGVLIGAPLLVVIANLDGFLSPEMGHLIRTVLPRYVGTTVALVTLVAALCSLVGIAAAWLVTVYDFPGRRALGWLLVLPLAIPTYIGALAYTGLFDYTGPAQLLFREVLGMSAGAYPILRVRGFGGLAFVLATLLYPYVYLTARAAFAQQGATLLEVTRSLGSSGVEAFARAVLPATRPALVAGVMLVVMETLGEFGASHYLGVDTLTIGIFRGWFGLGSVQVALALGALMLVIVALLQAVEHRGRGAARFCDVTLHDRPLVRRRLRGAAALAASAACSLPVITGFALPVGQLLWWASRRLGFDVDLVRLTATSIGLAAAATAATVVLAVLVAYAARVRKDRLVGALARWSTAGYAVPAAVLAVGIATAYTWVDHRLNDAVRAVLGFSPGLLLTASGLALIAAYVVRFFALGYHAIDSGFARIPARFDEVGRALGFRPGRGLLHVALPNLRPALMTASILMIVEMLKELPLTLILRPFRLETLATNVFRLAGNEQLIDAAPYALVIIAAGLGPVLILNRVVAAGRRRARSRSPLGHAPAPAQA
jgi:iron(III) transport system permease protein